MVAAHDAAADIVPAVGGVGTLTLVDGRTFAISDVAGDMTGGTHGLVHDDRRHVSHLYLSIPGATMQTLGSTSPTPLTAVTVTRLLDADGVPESCMIVRRRWLAGGMREDIEVRETGPAARTIDVQMTVRADFAHVFDVKAGSHGEPAAVHDSPGVWELSPAEASDDAVWSTTVHWNPAPDEADPATGTVTWHITVPPHSTVPLRILVEPVVTDDPVDLSLLRAEGPVTAIPTHRIDGWHDRVPMVVSTDHRLAPAYDQAVADLAALRIIDRGHPDRAITAAGAPWYMTLFGRDSLLTALMTLGFDPDLAAGVLLSLADLQGRVVDSVSEEQPGKILHELRRHGSGGPFSDRSRYYGTVDATPLFVMLAGEARRWGVLDDATVGELAPAIGAAVTWMLAELERSPLGWLCYQRVADGGLSNQGWKDSWNGVTSEDGTIATSPIALVEVQGYVYAALLAGADISEVADIGHDPDRLRARAAELRERFNDLFWDDRGWFVLGLDGEGRRIDSLTTNPGHALWTGIADDVLAREYLDRLREPAMWSGWGMRTLATSMGAYDPLSYHNGSVWPHDTALCAAGAARYGQWDIVDMVAGGLLDVATHFEGRPPELFAGLGRSDVPTPVAYPAACSPQAWSSASVLLLLRSLAGIESGVGPDSAGSGLEVRRTELGDVADLDITGLYAPTGRADVHIRGGRAQIVPEPV